MILSKLERLSRLRFDEGGALREMRCGKPFTYTHGGLKGGRLLSSSRTEKSRIA